MKTRSLNLFIVDENRLTGEELKEYLLSKFGDALKISVFTDGKSCIEELDSSTHVVIINNKINGESGSKIMRAIKESNPSTEIIMLADHEDIVLTIESFRAGAKGVVIKKPGSERKVVKLIDKIFMAPIRIIVKELGLSERLAIFLMSFLTIGVVVLLYFIFYK